jgi:uncharacterized membrane protein
VTAMIVAIVALALINIAFKAAGPAILADREFPPRAQLVIEAFSPALLAGLLVVELLGQRWELFDWTTLPGLLGAAIAWRLRAPQLACIAVGVVVTVATRFAMTLL